MAPEAFFVAVGEDAFACVDAVGGVAAEVEGGVIGEAVIFDGFEEAADAVGEEDGDVDSEGVLVIFEGVDDAAFAVEGDDDADEEVADGGDGADEGGGVIDLAFGDAVEGGGAEVIWGAVVVAGHDDGVGDVLDVAEDFFHLLLALFGAGFDFEVVVDEGDDAAGDLWDGDVDAEEVAPADFNFAGDFVFEDDGAAEAAAFFDEAGVLEFAFIPVVGLVFELEGFDIEDGVAAEDSGAEDAFVFGGLEWG